MAWTVYHDWLLQEAVALMTEPGWATNSTINTRLSAIRSELTAVKSTLKGTDTGIEALVAEFENARLDAIEANESRYSQLVSAAVATPNQDDVMSYPDLAKHMLTTHYADIGENLASFATEQATRDEEVVSKAAEVWTLLEEEFDRLGEQAASDIRDAFRSKQQELDQEMVSRGMHSSSLALSMSIGLGESEAAELRRLDEQIAQMKIQVKQTALSLEVQTSQNASQNQLALGGEEVRTVMLIAQEMARLYQLAPEVVKAREDVAPSLADVANLTLQLGRGSAAKMSLQPMQSLMKIVQAEAGG